jgi:small subunit ribosomal protein S7
VPIEVSENRRQALAMRWIISYAKSRKGRTMADRLSAELIAAANNEGSSVKKKEDTHRMAEANKAFSHFR